MSEPRLRTTRNGDLRIAGLDWGGDGPPLLFVHPTGFPGGFFDPLAQQLEGEYHCMAVDLRGHGASAKPDPEEGGTYTYEAMATDVIAFLDAMEIDALPAVGQSLGGGVLTLVDKLQPGRITRLVLAEGIAHPIAQIPADDGEPGDEPEMRNLMALIASKRRFVWGSRRVMYASYSQRPPLRELAPEALRAYLRWGVIDRSDNQVELACPPEIEAAVFEAAGSESGALAAWNHLPNLKADAVVLAGTKSDLPQEWFTQQAERANCPFVAVDGGHFFLQENSDRGANLVREALH